LQRQRSRGHGLPRREIRLRVGDAVAFRHDRSSGVDGDRELELSERLRTTPQELKQVKILPVQAANKHRSASLQEYSIPRERMVARLRDHYRIGDNRVLEAIRNVPRHFFVPEALQSRAY